MVWCQCCSIIVGKRKSTLYAAAVIVYDNWGGRSCICASCKCLLNKAIEAGRTYDLCRLLDYLVPLQESCCSWWWWLFMRRINLVSWGLSLIRFLQQSTIISIRQTIIKQVRCYVSCYFVVELSEVLTMHGFSWDGFDVSDNFSTIWFSDMK